ncbi:magnesium-translocating P-type ATPase [Spiroplasma culicicola]|uniref:Magnesium-transporting ATPase, P-type 1 n=1 Tax=Spiroplasma culicicola AES-1 TaxID=1276246 RepID=W6A6B9_9MOLU|nr:magnesium-translocating P-type ATPase [Spiroplasma culicicola]AHI52501.1 Mg(2+) transport ATPase, P-type [Spiroplasma culicicola AES-1]
MKRTKTNFKDNKSNQIKNNVSQFSTYSQKDVLKKFSINSFGLNQKQVGEFREKYGSNKLNVKKFNFPLAFLKSFFSPFNLILIIIDSFSFYTYFSAEDQTVFDLVGALIVLTMILLSGFITFFQEIKSHIVIKRMAFDNKKTCKVIRDTEFLIDNIDNANSVKLIKIAQTLDTEEIVPGDLIYLSNGDLIPADLKVLWSNNLYVNQSALTGEAFPVQKQANNGNKEYLEFENICYTGTNVVSGSAVAVVVATAKHTYFSTINDKVTTKRPKSSFDQGIKKITLLLISFMLAVTPLVFLVFGIRPVGEDKWATAAMFSISIAVGLTPEMLPIIVTANLSRGYTKIKQNDVLIKNLGAVQNMGAIDILCTDKTGTITSGEIKLDDVFDLTNSKNQFLKEILYLNSYFQTGFTNPIDNAVLLSNKIQKPQVDTYIKEWEVPFDFNRKILSVILSKADQKEIFTKGAVDEVLNICNRVYINGEIKPLDEQFIQKIKLKAEEMNKDGHRVIAIAHNTLEDEDIEEDLIFYGFATFFDEPKSTSKQIIKTLLNRGISTKILTGDSEVITRAICKKVDFKITKLYTGKEIEAMNETQLTRAVENANVFVKLSPLHKSLIIKKLKELGHVVGFMGDGINDAPVLRESDVAISFSDASNIAQDAADIILMNDSLMVLETAVHEGRVSLANILKYIKVTIASNFGNVLSVLVALFITLVEPMQPIHLLLQNLLYDIVMFAFIFDKVDAKFTQSPRPLKTKNIIWFTIINGPISSIFDIATFLVLLFAFRSQVGVPPGITVDPELIPEHAKEMFNASWFVVGLMTQTAVMQMYRTEKIPFIQSNASWQVICSTIFVCAMAIVIPYSPINHYVGMETPPLAFLPIALSFVIAYIALAQLVKMGYIRRFKEWL